MKHLRRLLSRWWVDEQVRWRVTCHVVWCGRECNAMRMFIYTGGSFESASARIGTGGCVAGRRCRHCNRV